MTDEQKREAYSNGSMQTGQKYQLEELPALVELVLDKLLEMDGDKLI